MLLLHQHLLGAWNLGQHFVLPEMWLDKSWEFWRGWLYLQILLVVKKDASTTDKKTCHFPFQPGVPMGGEKRRQACHRSSCWLPPLLAWGRQAAQNPWVNQERKLVGKEAWQKIQATSFEPGFPKRTPKGGMGCSTHWLVWLWFVLLQLTSVLTSDLYTVKFGGGKKGTQTCLLKAMVGYLISPTKLLHKENSHRTESFRFRTVQSLNSLTLLSFWPGRDFLKVYLLSI